MTGKGNGIVGSHPLIPVADDQPQGAPSQRFGSRIKDLGLVTGVFTMESQMSTVTPAPPLSLSIPGP
jgi:hypothetical protein